MGMKQHTMRRDGHLRHLTATQLDTSGAWPISDPCWSLRRAVTVTISPRCARGEISNAALKPISDVRPQRHELVYVNTHTNVSGLHGFLFHCTWLSCLGERELFAGWSDTVLRYIARRSRLDVPVPLHALTLP